MFGKNIKPACKYCEAGVKGDNDNSIICGVFGEVKSDDACAKFVYAPLKRIPVKAFTVTHH